MTKQEEENERLKEVNRQLNADYNRSLERLKSDCRQIDELKAEVKELKAELNARLTCDFEKTLVHELLHIKFCFLWGSGNDLQDRITHQLINDLAKSLVEVEE